VVALVRGLGAVNRFQRLVFVDRLDRLGVLDRFGRVLLFGVLDRFSRVAVLCTLGALALVGDVLRSIEGSSGVPSNRRHRLSLTPQRAA
jgi:hypothetical protein